MTAAEVIAIAEEQGFELAGVAPAGPVQEAAYYLDWAARGLAGEMRYLTDERADKRRDPRSLLASARSVLVVGKLYNTDVPYSTQLEYGDQGWVSRYAWTRDYHLTMKERLNAVASRIQAATGCEFKVCVDTAPLLERALAKSAGLGWIGKNTCLINQQQGSWFFLGEVLLSLDLVGGTAPPDRCGSCTRCIDACPTAALVPTGRADGPEYELDSRRCISYLTIELRGNIPEDLRSGIGRQVFGCDICQDVCPWNRRAPVTSDVDFEPRHVAPSLNVLGAMRPEHFRQTFRETPIERARYRGFLRNVAVAMGNSKQKEFVPMLRHLAEHTDEVIREHAVWALEQLR